MTERLMEIPADFWAVLSEMAPYLLFGFLAAGVLSVLVSPSLIERHLGGRGIWPVVKAAALGVPLPLCSCGVIPVSASLRRHGASRGATTSFLIATPQDGVDSIMATYSLLGGVFAIFRPLVALLTGVVGGAIVSLVDKEQESAVGGQDAPAVAPSADGHGRIYRMLTYSFGTLPRDIGRALLVGLFVAALISALVPKNYFANVVPPGIWQVLVLMLAGIPVYVCATASIPLAYALILTGVSPGAAFAFLMTGPATNAATIATVWKVMGRRTAMIYLAVMAAGALAGGLLLDGIVTGEQVARAAGAGLMLPSIVKHIAAVVLLGVLIVGIVRPLVHKHAQKAAAAGAVELKITGMTCTNCAQAVGRALRSCPGVASAEVDLDNGLAIVTGDAVEVAALCKAVEELGYGAEPIAEKQPT